MIKTGSVTISAEGISIDGFDAVDEGINVTEWAKAQLEKFTSISLGIESPSAERLERYVGPRDEC